MQTTYSKTFKIEAVKKVLSRTSETSMSAIARSLGVANTTLHGWVKAMENKDLRDPPLVGVRVKKVLITGVSKNDLMRLLNLQNYLKNKLLNIVEKKEFFLII
jgi:transposase-like protein